MQVGEYPAQRGQLKDKEDILFLQAFGKKSLLAARNYLTVNAASQTPYTSSFLLIIN